MAHGKYQFESQVRWCCAICSTNLSGLANTIEWKSVCAVVTRYWFYTEITRKTGSKFSGKRVVFSSRPVILFVYIPVLLSLCVLKLNVVSV